MARDQRTQEERAAARYEVMEEKAREREALFKKRQKKEKKGGLSEAAARKHVASQRFHARRTRRFLATKVGFTSDGLPTYGGEKFEVLAYLNKQTRGLSYRVRKPQDQGGSDYVSVNRTAARNPRPEPELLAELESRHRILTGLRQAEETEHAAQAISLIEMDMAFEYAECLKLATQMACAFNLIPEHRPSGAVKLRQDKLDMQNQGRALFDKLCRKVRPSPGMRWCREAVAAGAQYVEINWNKFPQWFKSEQHVDEFVIDFIREYHDLVVTQHKRFVDLDQIDLDVFKSPPEAIPVYPPMATKYGILKSRADIKILASCSLIARTAMTAEEQTPLRKEIDMVLKAESWLLRPANRAVHDNANQSKWCDKLFGPTKVLDIFQQNGLHPEQLVVPKTDTTAGERTVRRVKGLLRDQVKKMANDKYVLSDRMVLCVWNLVIKEANTAMNSKDLAPLEEMLGTCEEIVEEALDHSHQLKEKKKEKE